VTCRSCRHQFTPVVIERVAPLTLAEKTAADAQATHAARLIKIRKIATVFTVFSILSLVAGGLMLAIFVFNFNESGASSFGMPGLGCLAGAFWLFIGAQIVHIRACLEK